MFFNVLHLVDHIDVCQYEPMNTIQLIEGCCTSLTKSPIDRAAAAQVAAGFKALSDPVRVQIVSRIAASESGELCVCELPAALGVSQPTVSHHLRLLTEAGLLERDQRGKWAFFSLVPGSIDTLRDLLAAAT